MNRARLGTARSVTAGQGAARRGSAGKAWWLGKAGFGAAWSGAAGKARQARNN